MARIVGISLAAFLLLLFVLGLLAGPIVKSVVNRRLEAMPEYTGKVEGVSVSLWRGHVGIKNATFLERARAAQPPMAHIPEADLNVSYTSLLRGKLSAAVKVDNAAINIAAKPEPPKPKEEKRKEAKQEAKEIKAKAAQWREELARSFPVELSRLEITNAKVHFVDESKQPNVDVGIDRMNVLATGLTTQEKQEPGKLPARVEVNAVTTGQGKLSVTIDADPMARQPTFVSRFQLRDMSLPAFNSFLLAYADADVSAGTFEFDSEINAANGAYEGYVKPFFKDLNFKTPSDKDKNLAKRLKERAVGAVASVLKNDEEQKVATRAPFAGNFEDNQVGIWATVVNLLRNAFIQGIREGFEGQTPRT